MTCNTDTTVSQDTPAPAHGLEVIDKGSCTHAHPAPLLFVHGGAHAAWCWDEHFLNAFAAKGYRALAVSLRGHGASPASKPLHSCSIADYIDDVRSVADSLPARPVVIGHSMGGFVVQKYLESHCAPAGILLASAPPQGGGGFVLRANRRHPWLALKAMFTGKSVHMINTTALAREAFFSADTPEVDIARYAARFQEESRRAVLDMMFLDLPRPERVRAPLLVVGAEHDNSITIEEVRATARAYRTEAAILPGVGHDMMLEPAWPAVADLIHTWLAARGL